MGIVNDHRTGTHKHAPRGFVVATDSFMSGWGGAAGGKSYFAIEVDSENEGYVVMANMKHRKEMKRVRWVSLSAMGTLMAKVRRTRGNHLSISDKRSAPRFFEPGGFAETGERDPIKRPEV